MEERIQTLHPQAGKQGVRISKTKYDIVCAAIVETLRAHPGMSFTDLLQAVTEKLQGSFDGSVSWYVTTVKLDLEARHLIARVPDSRPQRLEIVE